MPNDTKRVAKLEKEVGFLEDDLKAARLQMDQLLEQIARLQRERDEALAQRDEERFAREKSERAINARVKALEQEVAKAREAPVDSGHLRKMASLQEELALVREALQRVTCERDVHHSARLRLEEALAE